MADISNKTLGILVGIALVVSVVGLFSLPNEILSITGQGTTGQARINITESFALNVTVYSVDFSNGTVTAGLVNCTLATSATGDPNACFTPSWSSSDGPQSGGFLIRNVGNVAINVTATSTKDASTFWGVSGGKYLFKCSGNGTAQASAYTVFDTTAQDCQFSVPATAGSDGFTVDINITIPNTATGYKNDTITFTASKA